MAKQGGKVTVVEGKYEHKEHWVDGAGRVHDDKVTTIETHQITSRVPNILGRNPAGAVGACHQNKEAKHGQKKAVGTQHPRH